VRQLKKVLKVIGIVVLVMIIASGGMVIYMSRGLSEGREMVIQEVDLSNVDDGVYDGSHQGGRWSNRVSVTVKDHEITQIEVTEDISFSDEALKNQIIDAVIAQQSTQVDIISGATVSSKAYLQSIQQAFQQ
jgi:uncharacterized protein with FMN-binding domain